MSLQRVNGTLRFANDGRPCSLLGNDDKSLPKRYKDGMMGTHILKREIY